MKHEEFKKFDGKKNRLELIEPEFIEGLGRILSFGADKYEANNWKKADSKDDQLRIYGALQRHLTAYRKGELNDPETGESHLYHACCNLMFLDYQDRKGPKFTVQSVEDIEGEGFTAEQIKSIQDSIKNTQYMYMGIKEGRAIIGDMTEPSETSQIPFNNYEEYVVWATTPHSSIRNMFEKSDTEETALKVTQLLSGFILYFDGFDEDGWIKIKDGRKDYQDQCFRDYASVEKWVTKQLGMEKTHGIN